MFPFLAIIAVLLLAKYSLIPRWTAWRQRSPVERASVVRFTIFAWTIGFVFLVAFLFLPNKGRVLLMLPVFLAGGTLIKWWQKMRARQNRTAALEQKLRDAKPIRPTPAARESPRK